MGPSGTAKKDHPAPHPYPIPIAMLAIAPFSLTKKGAIANQGTNIQVASRLIFIRPISSSPSSTWASFAAPW
jgi:hypothetical protein